MKRTFFLLLAVIAIMSLMTPSCTVRKIPVEPGENEEEVVPGEGDPGDDENSGDENQPGENGDDNTGDENQEGEDPGEGGDPNEGEKPGENGDDNTGDENQEGEDPGEGGDPNEGEKPGEGGDQEEEKPVYTTISTLYTQITTAATKDDNAQAYSVTFEEGSEAVVTYVKGRYAYVQDATGAVVYYKTGGHSGISAGKRISGTMSGYGYYYNNLLEIISLGSGAVITDGEAPEPEEVSLAALLSDYNSYISRYIKISDVEFTDPIGGSDKSGAIKTGSGTLEVVAQDALSEIPLGANGDLVCFPSLTKNAVRQLTIYEDSHFDKKWEPQYLSADKESYSVEFDVTSVEILVTSNAVWTATAASGSTLSTTLTPTYQNGTRGDGSLLVEFSANTVGEEKTATITLSAAECDDVTITVTQGAKPEENENGEMTENLSFKFTTENSTGWGQSYVSHTWPGKAFNVTFAGASKQTSTITDIPVTKGSPITVAMTAGKVITGVTLNCRRWNKAQTITLNTSTDGKNFTATDIKVTLSTSDATCTLSGEFEENDKITAVQFTFSNASNQIGIESLAVKYKLAQ